jgi:excisionase family DNA binding protein
MLGVKMQQKKRKNEVLEKLTSIESLLKQKQDQPLNFNQAAQYLGFSHSYLYKLTYRKVIPHYKPTGKVLFFSKNELDEWIFDKKKDKSKKAKVEDNENEDDEESESDPSSLDSARDDTLRVTKQR